MRLSLRPLAPSPHTDSVGALGWNSSNELFSCSHDFSIWRWNRNGEAVNKVYVCTERIGAIHWYPAIPQRNRGVSNGDMFAVGYSNGAFSIISKGGREERRIEAHKGGILSLKWNMEGTTLATGGTDGFVKLWSRNGMLRSDVFQSEHYITALSWAPDSTQLLFSSGKSLTIKQVQSSGKHNSWEGHDGPVVGLDWNRVTKLIVSIGEEGCYKIWDWFGRLLFKSESCQYSLDSVLWCPSGDFFVLGAHKLIMLCDKRGQILSKENMKIGNVKASAWSIDGSQIALGCTNGKVMFGQVIHMTMEWLRSKAILEDPYHIQIQDFLGERVKNLEFQVPVVNMSLGFGHLVVATISQCFVYHIQDWRTPYVINVKDTSIILKQCDHSFLIADSANELHIFTYEGRKLSNPYFIGLRKDLLNSRSIGLSKDTLAVIDCTDSRTLKLLDTNMGKELEQVLHHPVPIVQVDMNQHGTRSERILVFIDFHDDLFITSILKPCITKLSSLTTKAMWSSEAHIIAAMVEQDLVIWYYPQAVFVDEDLLMILQIKKESFKGKNAALHDFHATRCTIQYGDGAFVTRSLSPKPFLLFEYIASNKWDQATKLCWVFKEMPLWASIAAAAMDAKRYDIAEEAYTALDQIDKAKFIKHLKSQTSEAVREAEHALFTRRSRDAESILLNAGLIYRAIKLNLRLFNWDRALEIALMHKRHVDTVLWKRGEYLLDINQKETKEAFQNLIGQVQIDIQKIKQNILEDKNLEKNLK